MIDWRQHVRRRLPRLDIAPEREIEIVDELALQLESAYDAACAEGFSHEQALAAADAEIPDWSALAAAIARIEQPVAARLPQALRVSPQPAAVGFASGGLMSGLVQDLRYACRALLRAPGFAAVAIGTLALGIAATTIVYSLVDGILLKPLPIVEPDRVVVARELAARGPFSVAWPNFVDWRERAQSFERLAVWRGLPANLTGIDRPRRIMTRHVSWDLFDVLGVRPIAGRGLTPEDDRLGAERVVLVSYGFWQRELGGRAEAIGQRIVLDDVPMTVVGVLPADFTVARQEDAFLPLGPFVTPDSALAGRGNHNGLAAVGRLRRGVGLEQAKAELVAIANQLAQEYPATNSGTSATVEPLLELLVSSARPMLTAVFGAVTAMLLIACVNLANLLLARASARAQELAVRRALGAGSWRIGRQLLTESVLLSLCGGIAGIALAWGGFNAVVSLLPSDQPRVHIVSLDTRVMLVSAAVSILTGLLFGLLPAIHAATGRSLTLLRSARVTGTPSTRHTTRRALLLSEVALALILLAGAGLMLRTMGKLAAIDIGFNPDNVITAQLSLPPARYTPELRRNFYEAALERVRLVPGTTAAALTLSLPVQGSNWNSVFVVNDQPVPPRADIPSAAFTPVSPGYHETMGIRLLRGRLLEQRDSADAARIVVVNESFARRFWPGGDAVGQRVKQGWPEDDSPWREIVGVVADVKTGGVDQPAALQAYLPLAQTPTTSVIVVARTSGDPRALGPALESAVHQVDPNLPVYDIRTMNEVLGRGIGQQRLTTMFLLGFAVLALVMAAVGVFGVTAYAVSQRTHEIGVRMALGASRPTVLALVLRQELGACAIGILVGVAGAIALSSVLESLLYEVAPRDPATLSIVSLVLIAVTAFAGYLPARRATRIDPMMALRID